MHIFGLILLNLFLAMTYLTLFGSQLGSSGARIIYCYLMSLIIPYTFVLLYSLFFMEESFLVVYGTWIDLAPCTIYWSFYLDTFSGLMVTVVLLISSLIIYYSFLYMDSEPHLISFIIYINLFTLFMLIFITSDNFLLMFLGWEGMGACSFLLMSFWNTRVFAIKSALKAFLMNSMTDIFLLLGLILGFNTFYSLDHATWFALTPHLVGQNVFVYTESYSILTIINTLLVLGALGKSAQMGLHSWLPSAMEGPTPVSAFLHSATMVTAGMLLIMKCSPLLEYTPDILLWLSALGATTVVFGSTLGMLETDIKKIVAYSTLSQLGYMFLACGLSAYSFSFFHLLNHAFFKALLFLTAGHMIHSYSNEQDCSNMGSLFKMMPVTFYAFLMGSLALEGAYFFSGFYSKDSMIDLTLLTLGIPLNYSYWFSTVSLMFTAWYSMAVWVKCFGEIAVSSYSSLMLQIQESNTMSCMILLMFSVFSILTGYFCQDFFIGMGSNNLHLCLFTKELNSMPPVEFISDQFKSLPLIYNIFFAMMFIHFDISKYTDICIEKYTNMLKHQAYWENFYNLLLQKLSFYFGLRFYSLIEKKFGYFIYITLTSKILEMTSDKIYPK